MTDFAKGIIAGFVAAVIVFGILTGFWFCKNRDKELLENAERQFEIQALQEDYRNRDPVEFLDDPGVRGAADNAAAEFERKRNEALRAIRQRRIAR